MHCTALHQIPVKAGYPKPVPTKTINNNDQTMIMGQMKAAGYRLVLDVTKLSAELINKVALYENKTQSGSLATVCLGRQPRCVGTNSIFTRTLAKSLILTVQMMGLLTNKLYNDRVASK